MQQSKSQKQKKDTEKQEKITEKLKRKNIEVIKLYR
jgi:hypothetical protein